MGETRQPDARAAAWLAAHLNGASFSEIARVEGLHRWRIHYLVARHPDYVHGSGRGPPAARCGVHRGRPLPAGRGAVDEPGRRTPGRVKNWSSASARGI